MKVIDTFKQSFPYNIIVAIITIISFLIKITPWKSVFDNGTVRFTSNDPWYHMHLVNLLIKNWPHLVYYDPWTNYPYGNLMHFGPLFEYMIAIPAMIIGLGHPSQYLVDSIGAYFPSVLGALLVIPVYYIGKYLRGRGTGILAAILVSVAPGQLLSRTLIGFTDSHVAESLFSTLFIMFFMLAIITTKKYNVRFQDIFTIDLNTRKLAKPVIYSMLAGIAYAAYQLVWTGAPLFAFIICIYATVQYIINNMHKESSDYLAISSIICFLTASIAILPSVHPESGFTVYYYSWFMIAVTFGAIIGVIILTLVEKFIQKQELPGYLYPVSLLVCAGLGLIILGFLSQTLYDTVVSAPSLIFTAPSGGASTIGEAKSIFYMTGSFSFAAVFGTFTMSAFIFSILGISMLMMVMLVKPKPEEVLALVWSVMILASIYGQNRFGNYYSINIAILCAFASCILLEKTGWNTFVSKYKTDVKTTKNRVSGLKYLRVNQVIVLTIIVVIMILPEVQATRLSLGGGHDPSDEWTEACIWLKDNTPDPGLDWNKIYNQPENGNMFAYPDTAYGVMSWWDYGHYIEILGHRMPNANPFQSGIGGRRTNVTDANMPGAASFFTAQTEDGATEVLKNIDPRPDKLGTRYIMSDEKMASDIFMAMPMWTLDTQGYMQQVWTGQDKQSYQIAPDTRYYNSMEAKLHLFDGNGLKHYRLVHESPILQTNEPGYKQAYNTLMSANVSFENSGYVKIFEYVKGCHIVGNATPNSDVLIGLQLKTSQNRSFVYLQTTKSDAVGKYEFIVPYATGKPINGETQFDVLSADPYIIKCGDKLGLQYVTEEQVLKGEQVLSNNTVTNK